MNTKPTIDPRRTPLTLPTVLRRLCYAALLFLTACGPDAPRLAPLPPGAMILAYGDSLTSGVGASPGQDYPSRLAEITGFRIVNAGVPMEISAEGLERLPDVLERYPADLMILIHGGNDLLRHFPAEQTAANLQHMIGTARGRGIAVVLLGVPKPAVLRLSSAAFYADLAETNRTPIDTSILPTILGDPALKSDLVHPNNAGYRRLAEAVANLLRRSGAWNGTLPPGE